MQHAALQTAAGKEERKGFLIFSCALAPAPGLAAAAAAAAAAAGAAGVQWKGGFGGVLEAPGGLLVYLEHPCRSRSSILSNLPRYRCLASAPPAAAGSLVAAAVISAASAAAAAAVNSAALTDVATCSPAAAAVGDRSS